MKRVLKAGPLYWLAWLATSVRFVVHGDSMLPNFRREQYVLVRRLGRRKGPNRGDVVVFQHHLRPGVSFMKRVIGLPGDRVQVHNTRVFIDGVPLDEPYLKGEGPPSGMATIRSSNRDSRLECTLHEGQYFVLGDNRTHSDDSGRFGPNISAQRCKRDRVETPHQDQAILYVLTNLLMFRMGINHFATISQRLFNYI